MSEGLILDRCDARVLAEQIGARNIMAISGGRIGVRETGITLPVAAGYSVTVDLVANDTYVVRRVFRGKVKGEVQDVYCENVGEVAYVASCYVNRKFGEANGSHGSEEG